MRRWWNKARFSGLIHESVGASEYTASGDSKASER
jgi:hypothetical protein